MGNERSPNYPAIGLDQAVNLARTVYERERRGVIPTDVLANALGYTTKTGNLSGNALSRIAALRQYGLVDKAAQGKLKISERAINLVLGQPDSAAFLTAAKEAALSPPLFRDLFHGHGEVSDDALRVYLIRDRGFSSPDAANRVIKAFRDTVNFANLNATGYTDETKAEDSDDEYDGVGAEIAPKPPRGQAEKHRQTEVGSVSYSWPLGNGTSVELVFSSEPTRPNIDILLAHLQIVRSIAPEDSPKEQAISLD
jgi:hypothetical protein